MNKEYNVAVRFDQVQVGHLKIYAETAESAKEKATTMLAKHKNPEVLDVVEAPVADPKPSIIVE